MPVSLKGLGARLDVGGPDVVDVGFGRICEEGVEWVGSLIRRVECIYRFRGLAREGRRTVEKVMTSLGYLPRTMTR